MWMAAGTLLFPLDVGKLKRSAGFDRPQDSHRFFGNELDELAKHLRDCPDHEAVKPKEVCRPSAKGMVRAWADSQTWNLVFCNEFAKTLRFDLRSD